jgi:thioredoxin-like negative regulator of GroEL
VGIHEPTHLYSKIAARPHQYPQRFALAKTQLAAGRANDAGTARLDHLDPRALPQSEFLQAMNLLRITHNLTDFTSLSSSQTAQRNQFKHVCIRM